uniref:Ribosomal protein L16 n=2 Tax=Gelidium TaxID=2811 RepID=A0A1D8X7J9_9FLOR|nr:ribosomal protein L16 [Gelidium sinicola]YP_009559260.1 ribosomal protein L16 [Gelidium coulteri]AOX49008.1 ribosomal protein L16 [Gelidium sinicola]QBA96107.1 ribosomal protein L16 [Gelidium coulteri]
MRQVYKKTHNKYKIKGKKKFNFLTFGSCGLKATSYGRITKEKWESVQWALRKKFKAELNTSQNKIWNLVELNNSLTKLSLESRMGKGKGLVYTQSKFVREGSLLFEFDSFPQQFHKEIIKFLQSRVSIKLQLVKF